jgi:hypothetical protein
MLCFSQVVLYVPRIVDNLETWPVEIWVMNATSNGTRFGIVGLWVVILLQLEPASNLPSDGFDSGAISRELIWVPASCCPRATMPDDALSSQH